MFDIRFEADRLVLRGRLDASQAARADELLQRVETSVAADLAGLDYISSAGIGVLVKAQMRLQDAGHALRLENAQPRVRAVFHYSGLEGLFGMA